MAQQPEIAQISRGDLDFVYSILQTTTEPLSLKELTTKLGFEKTATELNQPLKKYDSNCRYEVGDLIYKEYNEPILVSSKNTEMFTGAVVLRVVNKIPYESFRCDMLEVDYIERLSTYCNSHTFTEIRCAYHSNLPTFTAILTTHKHLNIRYNPAFSSKIWRIVMIQLLVGFVQYLRTRAK